VSAILVGFSVVFRNAVGGSSEESKYGDTAIICRIGRAMRERGVEVQQGVVEGYSV
jgi:hypothetical protein